METLSLTTLVLATLGITFGALAKGTTGLGFPLIVVPILALLIEPRNAVVTTAIPNLYINLVILARGGVPFSQVRRVWPVLLTGIPGVFLGAWLLATMDISLLSILLGSFAVTFVLFDFFSPQWTLAGMWERLAGPPVGFLAGLLQSSTGASGPLLAIFLHSLRVPKRHFVYLITSVFVVLNSLQTSSYVWQELYNPQNLTYTALALAPTSVGLFLGLQLQDRLPQRTFSRLVLLVLLATGTNLVLRGAHVL